MSTTVINGAGSDPILEVQANGAGTDKMVVASSGQLKMAGGSSSAPGYSFLSDTASGFMLSTAGQVIFVASTNVIARVDAGFGFLMLNSFQLGIQDGSAGTPGMSFPSDSNTGVFRPGSDTLAISTGGSERMRIDSNGQVGISATSMDALLHVNGNVISQKNSDDANGTNVSLRKSRGSASSPTIVSSGDQIGAINFDGCAGPIVGYVHASQIIGDMDPNYSDFSDSMAGRIRILVTKNGFISPIERFRIDSDGNFGLNGSNFLSGAGVIFIANAASIPSGGSNPSGGGILYVQSGALKWYGSSGTLTTLGPAEPHCSQCESDYVLEWRNTKYGYLAICIKCLSDEIGSKPWIVRSKVEN